MRMGMGQFTQLPKVFSKKINHEHMAALYAL